MTCFGVEHIAGAVALAVISGARWERIAREAVRSRLGGSDGEEP